MPELINATDIVSEFDSKEKFDLYEVASKINSRLSGVPKELESPGNEWEHFIFNWYKIRPDQDDHENKFREYGNFSDPSIPYRYWDSRVDAVKNPLLKVRYAGACWDLSKIMKLRSKRFHAETSIDYSILIVEQGLNTYESDSIYMLKWALQIAFSIKDPGRQIKIRDAILAYEDKIAVDKMCGLWGFSYEALIENKRAKASILTKEIEAKIVGDLEGRLERLVSVDETSLAGNQFPAKMVTDILSGYYHSKDDHQSKANVILRYSRLVFDAKFDSAFVAAHHLESLFSLSKRFGVKDVLDAVAVRLREFHAKSTEEMKSISHEVTVSKTELDDFISKFTQGTPRQSILRFTGHYFPDFASYEERLERDAERFVYFKLMPQSITDHKGRSIAKVGTYPEDKEGQLIHFIASEYSGNVMAFFRHQVISAIIERFRMKAEDFVEIIYRCPIFEGARKDLYKVGIQEYLNGGYAAAIHILIPQIEEAIRYLIETTGGSVYKSVRNGGVQLKTLDALLVDKAITSISSDLARYFRIVFTDPRGINLRNMVCHGFYPPGLINFANAELILHAILCLALFIEAKPSATAPV